MSNRFRRRLVAGVLSLSLLAAGCSDDGKEDNAKPEPDGEVVGTGDRYEATIRRTAGGVPHITGDSVADVAFGQGWASGEDRTCDLAEQVLKVTGTRARWLGPGDDEANVESDLAWKAIGIAEVAAKDWTEAPDEVTESITAYVEGWNAHLAEVGADGVGGWCAGEAWVRPLEPVDVYTYARSVALLASSAAVAPMLTTAAPPGAADEATDDGDGAGTADEPDATGATGATEGASAGEAGAGDEDGGSAATTPADGARAADGSSGDASTSATGTGGDAASSPAEPVRVVPRPTTSVPSGRSAAQDRLASLPTDVFDDPALAGLRPEVGSNAWAIGSERSTDGGGMLLANPHFPWEGELRFWEVHLTVPGEVDIYGVQLSGLPGVGIGFTDTFGWSHTVSAGHRFTAYTLDLVEGSPTTYRYGDGTREMTSEEVEVEVLGDDGELTTETRTLWRSHYGPMLDFPGFGWTEGAAITFRDANIDNDEFIEQYLATMRAQSLDELIDLHRTVGGVPLFNTIATSADGRAWYGDTAATPRLSADAIAGYEQSLAENPIVSIAADNGAILLDGSDPLYEWEAAEGARDPGLVPFSEQPILERDDYVFNANDSFWLANADELLEGDYSPLHGRQRTARSPRTRENATVLADRSAEGPAGEDGTFTLDELADASLLNRGFTAAALRAEVVERCTDAGPVAVDALEADGSVSGLPAAEVDVSAACEVLDGWDGVYDLDRAGPPLWRELVNRFSGEELTEAGPLWADAFDAEDPVATPSGLADPPAGGDDPVLQALARAVQILEVAGLDPDVTLGEVQVADRDGTRVAVHGGDGVDGTTNVVGGGSSGSLMTSGDPVLADRRSTRVAPGSALRRVTSDGADPTEASPARYPIGFGTSFLLALHYGADGPEAKAFLTYGNTEDRSDPLFTEATEAFSHKAWRTVAFAEADVAEATESTLTVRG